MEVIPAALRRLTDELRQAWARFRALPPRWQASAVGAAALFVLLVGLAAVAVAVGGGNGGDNAGAVRRPSPTATRPPKRTPSPTPRLSATPTPTPGPTPTATPTPVPAPTPTATAVPPPPPPPPAGPAAGAYTLTPALPSVTFLRMVGFSVIPGSADEAVIVTQDGAIWRVSLGESFPPELFGDVSDRVIQDEYEGGLLGLAFSPGYPADARVYLYFTSSTCADNSYGRCDVLARYQVVAGSISRASERVLLDVADRFPNHNGGQLAFGPDGYLYLAMGDEGSGHDPDGNAQNLSRLFGKILRLDVSGGSYAIPPDNPFGSLVHAYGLRNPWRFSWDRATGEMWAGDVGQNRWEEVDRIVAGGNYGWDVMEGFDCHEPSSGCDQGGLLLPRAVYANAGEECSVTGGYVYRGAAMPELYGWYVYGDFCSGKIWALNTADGSAPVLLADTGSTIASFAELPDGELLVLAFDPRVYRLVRSQ